VFSYVEQQGGGQEILKKLYAMAEAKLSSAKELAALAESVMRRFGTEDWARTLYKKAAEAEDFDKLKFAVAESVQKSLGDHKLAGSLRAA
jgi:hypothetical protein